MQGCILRGNFKRRFEFRNGGVEVCHLQIRCSQVPFVSAVIGPQTDCRFELGDRSIAVTSLQQIEPQIIVRVRIFGLRFHGLAKCFDGLFSFATALEQ